MVTDQQSNPSVAQSTGIFPVSSFPWATPCDTEAANGHPHQMQTASCVPASGSTEPNQTAHEDTQVQDNTQNTLDDSVGNSSLLSGVQAVPPVGDMSSKNKSLLSSKQIAPPAREMNTLNPSADGSENQTINTPTPLTGKDILVPGANPWSSLDGFPAIMYRLPLPEKFGPVALLMYTIPGKEDGEEEDDFYPLPFIMLVLRQGHEEADLKALTEELANQPRRTVHEFSQEWLESAAKVFGRPVQVVAVGGGSVNVSAAEGSN